MDEEIIKQWSGQFSQFAKYLATVRPQSWHQDIAGYTQKVLFLALHNQIGASKESQVKVLNEMIDRVAEIEGQVRRANLDK